MKHLLLLRHAVAEVATPGASDAERPLTDAGHLEASDAAQCIARAGLKIDSILASTARRTRETADIVVARLTLSVPIVHDASLYLATPDTLLYAINGCQASTQTLLLVAHNPGISELAQQLAAGLRASTLRTGGLCHLSFARAAWSDLGTAAAIEMLR
jgi:phosphohistidine phosphatase